MTSTARNTVVYLLIVLLQFYLLLKFMHYSQNYLFVNIVDSSDNTSFILFVSHMYRQDGLSGSLDATKGETGLFGGSIDGTVVYGEDKPPSAFSVIPDFMLKNYNLQQTEFSRPKRVKD